VELIPGIVVAEIKGPLFFADADNFRQSLRAMVAAEAPYAVIVDLASATYMDMDGAEVLLKLSEELGRKGIKFALARVAVYEMDLLRKVGTLEAIGEDNIYETVRAAVAAVERSDPLLAPPPVPSEEGVR
jgi:anti-anti-sigma factor